MKKEMKNQSGTMSGTLGQKRKLERSFTPPVEANIPLKFSKSNYHSNANSKIHNNNMNKTYDERVHQVHVDRNNSGCNDSSRSKSSRSSGSITSSSNNNTFWHNEWMKNDPDVYSDFQSDAFSLAVKDSESLNLLDDIYDDINISLQPSPRNITNQDGSISFQFTKKQNGKPLISANTLKMLTQLPSPSTTSTAAEPQKNSKIKKNEKKKKKTSINIKKNKNVCHGSSRSSKAVPSPSSASLPRNCKKWTKQEDNYLRKCVELHGETNWTKMGKLIQRTGPQCSQRWRKVLDPNVLHNIKWTAKEDLLLVTLHALHPEWTNKQIAEKIPNRTPTQCHNRWCDRANPQLRWDEWTSEEDEALIMGRNDHQSWSYIVKSYPCLKNRAYIAAKNRWHKLERHRRRDKRKSSTKNAK
jgi:hypothetical protein